MCTGSANVYLYILGMEGAYAVYHTDNTCLFST